MRRRLLRIAIGSLIASLPFFTVVPLSAQLPDRPGPAGLERGDGLLTMALTGDAIITRALSPYTEPEFVEMIDLIRGADVGRSWTGWGSCGQEAERSPPHLRSKSTRPSGATRCATPDDGAVRTMVPPDGVGRIDGVATVRTLYGP